MSDSRIDPNEMYDADAVGELLGLRSKRRAWTVREIPPSELPRHKFGPRRTRFRGADVLAYMERKRVAA